MKTDREELEILRVSVACVAQAMGCAPADLPGDPSSFFLGDLAKAAETDRGWNELCGRRVLLAFLAWLPPGETDVALAVRAFWKIRTGDEL